MRSEVFTNPTQGLSLPAVRGRRDRVARAAEAHALVEALPETDRRSGNRRGPHAGTSISPRGRGDQPQVSGKASPRGPRRPDMWPRLPSARGRSRRQAGRVFLDGFVLAAATAQAKTATAGCELPLAASMSFRPGRGWSRVSGVRGRCARRQASRRRRRGPTATARVAQTRRRPTRAPSPAARSDCPRPR